MQTFDQSLFNLFKTGLISYESLRRATNPDDFALKVKGIVQPAILPSRRSLPRMR